MSVTWPTTVPGKEKNTSERESIRTDRRDVFKREARADSAIPNGELRDVHWGVIQAEVRLHDVGLDRPGTRQ